MKKTTQREKPNSFYAINAITFYRLIATTLLLYLIFNDELPIFKWILAFSFFTDMIDGSLARYYKVSSILGSRLDSVADDLTVVVAMIGVYHFKHEFISAYYPWMLVLLFLYLVQMSFALVRYKKVSSFHTRSAKLAFLLQGCFLILIFFLPEPPMWLFYPAVIVTSLQLVEETILVTVLPQWKTDVKGLYWVLKDKVKNKKAVLQ